jgi:hypothetical protein
MTGKTAICGLVALLFLCNLASASNADMEKEKSIIEQTIRDSIEWPYPEKDVERLRSSLAKDPSFFIFHPDSASTIVGYAAFEELIENLFMQPDLKPLKTDIKGLRINLAESGTVAWFSCLLDDIGEFRGRRWEWLNCRWTGVLEKRAGKWLVVQMHFSLPQP